MTDIIRFFLVVAFMLAVMKGTIEAIRFTQEQTQWHGYQDPSKSINPKGSYET